MKKSIKETKAYWIILLLMLLAGAIDIAYAVPAPYNLTLAGNSSGIVSLAQTVNAELMGGYFGVLILITMFALTSFGFIQTTGHTGKSITASSFLIFVLALLLRVVDLVSDITIYVTLALVAFSVAILIGRD